MNWLPLCDRCLLALAFFFPIYSVLKWNRSGILWGTLANWGSIVIAGALITILDPRNRNPLNSVIDVIWFLFGWVLSLAYCYLIVLIRLFVRELRGLEA